MSQSSSPPPNNSLPPAELRLQQYCRRRFGPDGIYTLFKLLGDASTRQYFRVSAQGQTFIAAVYPEAFDPEYQPYCDVTALFMAAQVPVPQMIDISGEEGIILQEDLGDIRLQDWLPTVDEATQIKAYQEAIGLILQIQKATALAYDRHSVASKLAFDEARLFWELKFFYQHYLAVYPTPLTHTEDAEMLAELNDIARELSLRPRLLTHRDYHSRNLMVGSKGQLFVIDHQDARMGPFSYDLASLLFDPYADLSEDLVEDLYEYYLTGLQTAMTNGELSLARTISGAGEVPLLEFQTLSSADFQPDDFRQEFHLMTVQRMLKAVGTYTYQKGQCGNDVYACYIDPALRAATKAMQALDRFPNLRQLIASHPFSHVSRQ